MHKSVYFHLGIGAGLWALQLPETNGNEMLETLEEAEEFYRTGKMPEKFKLKM